MSTDVLIDENRISIGIDQNHACWATGRFISFGSEGQSAGFQTLLNDPNVLKFFERLCLARPARVKRERVFLEHPLEQADCRFTVAKD